MAMPAMPAAGLVVGKAQLGLGGLEHILDRPPPALHGAQDLDPGPGRAPGGEEGKLPIREAAPDQEPARP